MRKLFYALAALIPAAALVGAACFGMVLVIGARAATVCTPTGFFRDAINLTAAVIDPPGTYTAVLNASPCNIGVYYSPGAKGTISNSEIYGANYFGVVNNGGKVTIKHSFIHDIGEMPFNGTQHGVGIYFAYNSGATGSITNNRVTRYQKGGIAVTGLGDSAQITGNTVIGLGPVNFIAQNGIELGAGAKGSITNNNVSNNSYTGPGGASSGGILLFGGSCYSEALQVKTNITGNTVTNNDVGVWSSNLDVDPNNPGNCLWPTHPTNNYMARNTSSDDAVTNTTGAGTFAYQAAISDQGNGDRIIDNKMCGVGYTPTTTQPYLYQIDIQYAVNVTVKDNTTCGVSSNQDSHTATRQAMIHTYASILR
ncbi:MAG TPA: right-handed parallel beta-helix repeat-containing protein [Ktedonobacteraceae bacterium]|nr:right-handed parallel beta-helix repeat-containing protein [Ktedonobacteraceae bacterium]